MSRTILRTTIAICALAVTSAAASGQTPGFSLVGSAPNSTTSWVSALSQHGQIAVGGHHTSGSGAPGFTWTATTGRDDFGLSPGMPLQSPAMGVDSSGTTLVGIMGDHGSNPFRAYRRVGSGPLENLGNLPGPYTRSYASAVSGDGQIVVGRSEYNPSSTSLITQAVRWTPQTGMQGLGYLRPGHFRSQANAISRDGSTVVGWSNSSGVREAFVWREGTGMQPLPQLPGAPFLSTSGNAVSASASVIAGEAINSNGRRQAVRWTSLGIESLGSVGGQLDSIARAVDDSGDVIGGVAYTGATSSDRAFVWTPQAGMVFLSDYLALHQVTISQDWNLIEVYAISGDGLTFAGEARSTSGVRQGFVATIPAPSGVLVVFSSALLVMRRRGGGLPRIPPMGASVPESES
jgi:probable HAF family extracellular repeat protein